MFGEVQVEYPARVLPEGLECETATQDHRLRDKCLVAFREYANEVHRTCELLGELTISSAPLDQLLAVVAQAQIENRAQEIYLWLREQLFEQSYGNPLLEPRVLPDKDATFSGTASEQRIVIRTHNQSEDPIR